MKKPEKLRGLYLRGNTWWFAWTPPGGVREFVSLKTSDYGEAVREALKVADETAHTHKGERISDERTRFIDSKKKSGAYSRHSAEWAVTPLKHLEKFCGNAGVASITPAKLEAFALHLRGMLASESSTASYMRAVRSFFSWLQKRGSVRINPAANLSLPKVTQSARVEFCTKELRDKLIEEAPNDEMRLILLLGFHAGLRKGEIVEARPEWIEGGKVIHIEKTDTFRPKDRERRAVPMTSALVSFFASHPINSPFLIRPEKKHAKALYRFDFREPFESYMTDQKCEWVTPHTMRRTFASLLVSSGVSIYKVARWLGDGVAVAEKHYGHLTVEDADIDRSHITSQATHPASPAK